MPTGYTAGIIDGSIKDFKQFATLCMRAFGATMHMRDDPFNAEYKPQTPSDYHIKEIRKAKSLLRDAKNLPDAQIVSDRAAELRASKEHYIKRIAETKEARKRLEWMLEDAQSYEPPTAEHEGIKKFMIDQITSTIVQDGDTKYYDERLFEVEDELHNLSAVLIRLAMTEKASKDLAYHKTELEKEVKRCNDSNKWVVDFLQSLNGETVEAK